MKIKNILLTSFFIGISVAGAVEIPLKNAAFATKGNVITDWFPTSANQKIGSATAIAYKDGKNALKISSSTGTTYFGVWQGGFDLKKFPRPAKDEKLVVTMTFRQKNEKVLNGGFVNFTFLSKKGYLMGRDSKKLPGTFDWSDREVSVEFPAIPAEAAFFTVRFFLGKTTGTICFAEPKLFMEVVKK